MAGSSPAMTRKRVTFLSRDSTHIAGDGPETSIRKSRRTRPSRPAPKRRGRMRRCSTIRWRTCSIPASARAPPDWARRPGCSNRPTTRGTAAPISPMRIAPAPRWRAGSARRRSKAISAKAQIESRLGELDPDLAKALGIEERDRRERARRHDQIWRRKSIASRARTAPMEGGIGAFGSAASQQSLDRLLREGRDEFRGQPLWTPHRPPRPDKSEGGRRFVIKSDFDPKGDQPTAIKDLVEGVRGATIAPRCCSASPARARPSRWPR